MTNQSEMPPGGHGTDTDIAPETRRLARLHELMVLDSAPEPLFDGFVRLASEICGAPIALVSLVDAERQWFKANVGLPGVAETPRDVAFCAHAVASDELMQVPDAAADARFAANPLVTGAPDIRFYAGAPLVLPDGERVGTLCVIDRRPRRLDEAQQRSLRALAALVAQALDMRRELIGRALAARSEYERALAASEAHHRAIVEEQNELVVLSDAERRIVYVNPACARHFGTTAARIVGRGLLDGVDPAHRAGVAQRVGEALRSGLRGRAESRTVAPDGSVRWVEWTSRPTVDAGGGKLLLSVGRDVTERKQAEEALRTSRALLSRTSRVAGVGGWEMELASGAIAWSDETYRIHELPLGRAPSYEQVLVHYPPAARARLEQAVRRAVEHGEAWDLELPFVTARGRARWVRAVGEVELDDAGQAARLTGAVQDITERKHLEQRLAEGQALLARTSRVAGIGGWELDLGSGAIAWSDETCRIHELPVGHVPTLDEAIGYYAPASRPAIEQAVQRGIAHGEPWDLELEFVTARGRPLWVRAVGEAEFDDAGRAVRLTGAFQDVTERRRLERQLADSERFMRQITDAVPVRLAYLDHEARFRFVNQAHCRRFGLAREDILGRTRAELTRGAADDASVALRLAAVLRGEPQRFEFEEQLGGEARCIESQLIPDLGDDGRVRGFFTTGTDITDRKRIERALAGQHELTRVTLHSIADAVVTTDAQGRVQYMNPVAEQLAGWSAGDAAGRPVAEVLALLDEGTRQPAVNPVERCLADNRAVALAGDTLLVARDGSERGIEDSASPMRGAAGEVLGAVLVFRDVTVQRQRAHEMSYRATHDALTGLVNRAEFESRLARLLDKSRQDGAAPHALMAIDLDRFKLVNDACGHAAGDRLLRQVSALLRQCVRAGDTVARLGGDEFGVILECCPVEQAKRVAQQICDRMEGFGFVHDDGRRFNVGASVGLVPLDARWPGPGAAMKAADGACYAAKHAGRSRVHTGGLDGGDDGAAALDTGWAGRLQRALDDGAFALEATCLEPLAAPKPGDAADALALRCELRPCLIEPDGTRVAATAFMPVAERLHLAPRVDRWLIDAACARLAGDDGGAVALAVVPLAAASVADRALHQRLAAALGALGPRAAALCFEVGEAAALAHPAQAADLLVAARAAGARVALGGLGAGIASVGLLRRLPVDFVRIDGAIVRGAAGDALDRAALRCWRDAAAAVGALTVADGVEQREVLAVLGELGIDHAQGRLVHEAEPLDALLARAASRRGALEAAH